MDQKQFDAICQQLREREDDLRPTDIFEFPEPLRSTLNQAVRVGRISLTEMVFKLDLTPKRARELASLLIARNLLRLSSFSSEKEIFYETPFSATTRPLGRPLLKTWNKDDESRD